MLQNTYKGALWEIYARAISLISILVVVTAFVLGGYDIVEWTFPRFTLNASLQEKHRTDEEYVKSGAVSPNLAAVEITRDRVSNYEKLLRIERRNAQQSLIKVGLALLIVSLFNTALVFSYRWKERCHT